MAAKDKERSKFAVRWTVNKEAVEHEFDQKGLAFALAKKKIKFIDVPHIEVEKYVAVAEKDANPKTDHREGRRWWRAAKRWEFFADGGVRLAA